ncbi:hypothetical protein SASPL_157131 [Salvia splendens]|uniref:Agglutinin domain-containing protein n=1 Tax=Salvia splendens TaxID=180675 RepID=A0A4D8Y5E7_SALSN|nr:uncharacterized protein LOC121791179 [Salvia splendens]XP_042045138.1 uncharacterized protein LOC121791180 [Salvia splendens]KAG6383121.1 hypothetical protein SASPL_157129 [Salvia splendens]KAG6383123.1 hypothetical protein SASPL_157131 [Salvia splendens]
MALPNAVVLNVPTSATNTYLYRKDDGSVANGGDNMFSPMVKIEIEQATAGDKYVHLRFSYYNKYWQKSADNNSIVAVSNKPEEDVTMASCTLFEPSLQSDELYLTHVQSGWRVMMDNSTKGFYIDKDSVGATLGFVDWGTLVKMPPHIAVKGDNGHYLKAFIDKSNYYLQFASDDSIDVYSGHTVSLMPDGHVQLISDHFGKLWWASDSWIYADGKGSETSTHFWPIKIDNNTIALQSASNNRFCGRLTSDGVTDGLASLTGTLMKETRLQVEELVSRRKIYYVRYRMENARVYDEKPYLAGTARLTNNTDKDDSMAVSITYQDEKSYTFSRGASLTAGVSTSIKAGLPFIADEQIEVSFEISGTLQWDETTTTTTSVTATGTVPVPANTMAVIDYVGTRGSCNIPFSYTQEDHNSTNGRIAYFQQIDGVYNGVSYYNFDFRVRSVKPM